MRVAVIGSRNLRIDDLGKISSGKHNGNCQRWCKGCRFRCEKICRRIQYSSNRIFAEYKRFGKGAPLKRNLQIIEYADMVLAFWDGKSHGTKFVIDHCRELDVPVQVIIFT